MFDRIAATFFLLSSLVHGALLAYGSPDGRWSNLSHLILSALLALLFTLFIIEERIRRDIRER